MPAVPAQSPASTEVSLARLAHVVWRLTGGHRMRYLGSILLMLLTTGIGFVSPLILRSVLDEALGQQSVAIESSRFSPMRFLGGAGFVRTHLWVAGLAILSLTVVTGLLNYLRGRWTSQACEGLAADLRKRLFAKLQRLTSAEIDRGESGDLIQRCTSDVETFKGFLAGQVVDLGHSMMLLVVAVPIMLLLDWRMAVISLVSMPILVGMAFFFFRYIRKAFRENDEAESRMTTVLQENLTGTRVVRAFAAQEPQVKLFDAAACDYRDRSLRIVRLMSWYWSTSDCVSLLQVAASLSAGAILVMRGELSLGTMIAFSSFMWMMLWPVRQMGRILTDLGRSATALGRLEDVLHREAEPESGEPLTTAEVRGEIVVRDLVFGFQPDRPILNGISLRVPAGSTLGIVGPSGSGKSVLLQLLLRMYECEKGDILLDGRDVRLLRRDAVRGSMGVVFQEPFLFARTIADNLDLGRRLAQQQLDAATDAACFADEVRAMEKGTATMLGERGVRLSGGQRQRLAIARAIASNPPILLLDDALSAVDTHTEARILTSLRELRTGRTTIIVAHRLSVVAHADQIIVLEKGVITQRGAHAELATAEGLYRRLWLIQTAIDRHAGETGVTNG